MYINKKIITRCATALDIPIYKVIGYRDYPAFEALPDRCQYFVAIDQHIRYVPQVSDLFKARCISNLYDIK